MSSQLLIKHKLDIFEHLTPQHMKYLFVIYMALSFSGLLLAQSPPSTDIYVYELKEKKDAINTTARFTQKFHYDILTIMNENKGVDPRNYRLKVPIEYQFYRDNAQKQLIDSYVQRFGGNTIDSLGKILMKSGMMNLFRKVSPSSYSDVSL